MASILPSSGAIAAGSILHEDKHRNLIFTAWFQCPDVLASTLLIVSVSTQHLNQGVFMEFMITVTGAVIATLVMAAVMYSLVWDGFGHGDMIRLLGSDITQQPRRYFSMGMVLYLLTGLALSWLYYMALNFFQFDSVTISAGFGGFMGFTQGFILMNFYIVELGSRHPNEQYKHHWLPLAFAHWFGHILFGAALGSMISAFLIHGSQGFLIAAFVNLLFAGGLTLLARKSDILSGWKRRQHTHV
jgi:hypothetical protein